VAARFTVRLSQAATAPVTVDFETIDGTAQRLSRDYFGASGTLLFGIGEDTKTIDVDIIGDTFSEPDETLSVQLSRPQGATLETATATATIGNDDAPPQTVITIVPNTLSQPEGNSGTVPFVFTVSLNPANAEPVTVNYQTVDGTATVADGDYQAATGTLTFTPGQQTQQITVNVVGDTKANEGAETFAVQLSNPSANVTLGQASVTVTISDDDGGPTPSEPTLSIATVLPQVTEGNQDSTANFVVSLSQASTQPVTVTYSTVTATGGATADTDFIPVTQSLTLTPGQTSQTIGITIKGDTIAEANEAFAVQLTNPSGATLGTASATLTIVDDDGSTPPPSGGRIGKDGDVDLFWYNRQTGQTALWQVNATPAATQVNLSTVSGQGWDYAGAADFDGDGDRDLLWHNQFSGETVLWRLQNSSFQAGVPLQTVSDIAWQIQAIGDVNGDQTADIIWQNRRSGEVGLWLMAAGKLQTAVSLPTVTDLSWKLQDVADFSGDQKLDLLWRNDRTGENALWLLAGGAFRSSVPLLTVTDLAWSVAGVRDLTGEGQVDILWRHRTSGEVALWQMAGTTYARSITLGVAPEVSWEIAGLGDYNRDGNTDLLWRNARSGENALWYLLGPRLSLGLFLQPSDPVLALEDTADFNRDGELDYLWRNPQTGSTFLWQTIPSIVGTTASVLTIPTPANWSMAATADFSRDGNADLLWRNLQSGEVALWVMNQFQLGTTAALPRVAEPGWIVGGVGDFDRDGDSDLLWYNPEKGNVAIWQMNGTSFGQTVSLTQKLPDRHWQVEDLADFDQDGYLDILWRNDQSGALGIWRLLALSFAGAYQLPTAGVDWQVQSVTDFTSDRQPDLLWRNRVTGEVALWRMNGVALASSTVLTTVSDVNWQIQGSADVNQDGFADLLWYNPTKAETVLWYLAAGNFGAAIYLPNVGDGNWQLTGIDDFRSPAS
jgi:hypothetical protein